MDFTLFSCGGHGMNPLNDEGMENRSQRDLLSSCVHCGFCLEVCPTYQLTGDENNSPRGRLRLWKAEAAGDLPVDAWTDFYTSECVGCLACEPACPANVPYGQILNQVRNRQVAAGRNRPSLQTKVGDYLARRGRLFDITMMPLRWLRRSGWLRHRRLFAGRPAVVLSTASYASDLMKKRRPTGPRVGLFTGCLMESVFREINFATVRVLIENNFQVVVPSGQACCGAFQHHAGLGTTDGLDHQNRQAFSTDGIDVVLTNSSGCGLALMKAIGTTKPVRDVIDFLEDEGSIARERIAGDAMMYIDLPCHLVHGQRVDRLPERVFHASGYRWELAPMARECCGAGGTYQFDKPENARKILERKSAFLRDAPGDPIYLVTTNHVCMMQWNSIARSIASGRSVRVRHLIQMLDPGEECF
jgi:glycolate oxidase iron-sulfur subunit